MNILLISECSKQALPETRRIIDQFAERKGQRTWQTPITHEGLLTLRKLLKKTARRNTAIACYRIYGKNYTELLWMVGSRKRFNQEGTVPTNITRRDVLRAKDENSMHSIHAIALMAGLAGLFHDLGKANCLFQSKLTKKRKKQSEPFRHEWVSALLFLAFVNNRKDTDWLTELTQLTKDTEASVLARLMPETTFSLSTQDKLASCVSWLIVSHHRLPKDLRKVGLSINEAPKWFESGIHADWNALNHLKEEVTESDKKAVYTFLKGTPFMSRTWRKKAKELAIRALKLHNLSDFADLNLVYPVHLARMVLMLADHAYSADSAKIKWQDENYAVFANTDRKTAKPKQQLDEHCVGVSHHAYLLAGVLPKLKTSMPSITRHPELKKRTHLARFRWQNKPYELALGIKQQSLQQGFFGVNMASTGKGKTFANAKIMYGLSDEARGCRFSVALGLRTLTLQTGEAFREKLQLDDDTLAVVIGSAEVSALYLKNKEKQAQVLEDKQAETGSDSAHFFNEHLYVKYDGEIENTYLNRWLGCDHSSRRFVHSLVSAPVSVSTIDYLIPATEGVSGGLQIAPMLRLMTSDLVLDEPDDFGLEDIPALTRLVYWAGLLGSRVLLSSATLPPSLTSALFDAYCKGREQYNKVHGEQINLPVLTLWCDEFNAVCEPISEKKQFLENHTHFVRKRQQHLTQKALPLHLGKYLTLEPRKNCSAIESMARTCFDAALQLAATHRTLYQGKTFSAGIIRMANIEPLVALAKVMFSLTPCDNTRLHFCVYHSQYPLAVRSAIEHDLDAVLRRDPNMPNHLPTAAMKTLKQSPEQHHVLIVLATPVAEVGRDHDYDWAIAEPSSVRALIQLAGRLQRHRQLVPSTANLLVLTQNYRALINKSVAYCKPGFESDANYQTSLHHPQQKKWLQLLEHQLPAILDQKWLAPLTAEPRIIQPGPLRIKTQAGQHVAGFIELEHLALNYTLRDKSDPWWTQPYGHLFGEIQRQTPFRKSYPKQRYIFSLDDEFDTPELRVWDPLGETWLNTARLVITPDLIVSEKMSFWGQHAFNDVMQALSDEFDISLAEVCQRFATIDLDELEAGEKWFYYPSLGVYRGSI